MSTVNEVKNKIALKNQEIIKLQSNETAMKIEIEKIEKQLKLITKLMDNFQVILLYLCMTLTLKVRELIKI